MWKYTIIYSIACLCLISCKDYLDIKATSGQATPNSLEALQQILDNMEVMNISTNPLGEASADNYFLLPNIYTALDFRTKETYTWNIKSNSYPNDWANGYLAVYHSNIVIDNLGKITRTEENAATWDKILGTAYFYRSYAYLTLLWTYAKGYDEVKKDTDLGIVLRDSSDPNKVSKRATVGDCYVAVIQGLEKAISLLPKVSEHVLRPSKSAAYGVLARTYLSMRKYKETELYSDSSWVASSVLLDYNALDSNALFPMDRYNPETVFFSQMSNTMPAINYFNALVDTILYESYDKNDLRSKLFFLKTSDKYYQFKGSYSGAQDFFTGISNAEVLLMRSESRIRNGKISSGLDDLNLLMRHRFEKGKFIEFSNLDKSEALDIVLTERRKELVFRGLRWMDVKRLNIEGSNIILRRKIPNGLLELLPNDSRYALPIPEDLVDMIGLEQNSQ